MRLFLKILSLAALLGGAATSAAMGQTHEVALTQVSDWRPVFGAVQSVKEAPARIRLAGTLVAVDVSEGDAVQAGQRIARVEDEKIAQEIAALRAGLRALDAEAAQAAIDLERAQELRERGAVPVAALDQARTAMTVVEEQRAARRAELEVTLTRQSEGDVLAPEAGRVLSVPVVQGMAVQPGETAAVIATENFILRARLPERHARFLGLGEPVRIAERGALSGGGDSREGRISKIYPELAAGEVIVDIQAPDLGDYFVGERIRLDVATGRRDAIIAPRRFLDRRHGVTFARLEEGGEVVVQPGAPVEGGIEILAGLKPGDRLVAYPEGLE
ncbi:MAG: efflux RND transporter periplasmic adaptor subunit [Pseudomonadota bacterium]